jgi:hypothetical protein
MSRKKFAPNDVTAGRAYVQAYVRYIHYVDGLYQAAIGAGQHHPGESAEAHADDSRHNGKP